MPFPARVLYNDGQGRLGDSARALEQWPAYGVALGDLNGDGAVDALLDITAGALLLYRGDGQRFRQSGFLADASPGPWGVMRLSPVLGDLNGDGRLDVFAAGCCGREPGTAVGEGASSSPLLAYSRAWLQTEDGQLVPGPALGQTGSPAAALADLNGDGSLDVFLANGRTLLADGSYQVSTPDTVWLNDGRGTFTDTGQQLGQSESLAVALGDLNGDGAADAVVGNRGPDEIWLNDGRGAFADSGQRLGSGVTSRVFLADLDADGDLDLFAAGPTHGQAWLNDGQGRFQPARQRLRCTTLEALAVGDLTGDGLADVLVAGPQTSRVWTNDGRGRFSAGPSVAYP
jgi:hypothetical protein